MIVMWRRRIGYVLLLAAALFGQLLDVGYLFHFVFVMVLFFPLIGLVISLPSMIGCRVELATSGRVIRGETFFWEVTLHSRGALPLSRLCGTLRTTNIMTGETRKIGIECRTSVEKSGLRGEQKAARSGCVLCQLEHLRMCDCLGLFALPVRAPKNGTVLIYPTAETPGHITLPEEDTTTQLIYRGRNTLSDAYDLRDYRPGDRIRSIHWKLTAKRDETVVREPLELKKPQVVLTFEHFGAPKTVERGLGRLLGFAAMLLDYEREFDVCWLQPETGAFRCFPVRHRGEWEACLEAILSERAPKTGRSIVNMALPQTQNGAVYQIHVTGKEQDYAAR